MAYHFHGTINGHTEIRRFFEHDHPYLIPGVGRHATNHIVDEDEDGVVVRYQNLLIRYASPEDASKLGAGQVMHSDAGLPAIWLYSPDAVTGCARRRRVEGSVERYIGGSTTSRVLTPADTSAAAVAPYLPKASGRNRAISSLR